MSPAQTLLSVLASRLGVEQESLSPETSLADFKLSPLTITQVVIMLEEALSIHISDEDIDQVVKRPLIKDWMDWVTTIHNQQTQPTHRYGTEETNTAPQER